MATTVGFDADRLARLDAHFRRYVDDGRLPGWQILIGHRGEVVHHRTYGARDIESGAAWSDDTIVRLFSMTKPITSVAAMMLYEEGRFQLKDPVATFLPEFADAKVYRSGNEHAPVLDPLTEPLRIWHLLTHTSGLTYGFHRQHITDSFYRAAGYEWGVPAGVTMAEACKMWASFPLAFQPGTEWLYSVSTDVLGRVVEVISGQSLGEFFDERIMGPLGMVDTRFGVQPADVARAASLYVRSPSTDKAVAPPIDLNPPEMNDFQSGGGGLWGTAADYLRFCRMLLNGGELDGNRIIGDRTVSYMTRNHLPGGADLEAFGRPLFSEMEFAGVGFGLGFSIVEDPAAYKVLSTAGEYAWGGAASTTFWCDPVEDLAVVFLTQLLPSSTYPIRPQLKQLVYQALVGPQA